MQLYEFIILTNVNKLYLIFLSAFLFISCTSIVVQDYETTINKSDNCIRIVQLSDLHSESFGESQFILLNLIKNSKPDLIFLTGDIFEGKEPFEKSVQNVITLLKGIKTIAPFYYVTGNHEYAKKNNPKDYKKIIRDYGGIVLEQDIDVITVNRVNIIIAGVDDPFLENKKQRNYDEHKELYVKRVNETALKVSSYEQSNPDKHFIKVLLAHRPEYIKEYQKFDFDLILSGHTHGGQWRLPPFINGIYSSTQGMFPKYSGGRYKFTNSTTFIINRGLAIKHPNYPRIFNNPEIVVVSIQY